MPILTNDLGNLLHRTVVMIQKFNDGAVPERSITETIDEDLVELGEKTFLPTLSQWII